MAKFFATMCAAAGGMFAIGVFISICLSDMDWLGKMTAISLLLVVASFICWIAFEEDK